MADGPLPTVPRRLADPALLFDLLEEVGDPDGAGPAGVERRLDGRADVIGVDVAVPQAVPADHHDRVAEAGPHLLERRDGLVGRLEQVHDLVAQAGQVGVGIVARRRPRRPGASGLTGPKVTSGSSGGRGIGRPSSTESRASNSSRKPVPPASTTPACSRTGRSDGVRARASAAPAREASATSTSDLPASAAALASSAAPRATVRMVPSTGRITASRASLSAMVRASGSSRGPGRPVEQLRPSEMPRSSWDRMTPELPRAPISEPWAMARQVASRSGESRASSSSVTDSRVRAMLVPVSPSGTG